MRGRSCGRSTTATSASPTTPGVGWRPARTANEARVDVSSAHVTAVLVTLDAARWLPYTLEALEHLQDRPHRLIAIDNASSDITLTLLEHARDQGVIDAVYSGKRTFGFGTAVKAALRQDRHSLDEDPTTSGMHAVSADDSHWLWLLHDDAVPAPDALHRLLAHVITDRSIDITGPKLVLPKRRHGGQQISEIGVSISGTGRRELAIDSGEIDQGQRDQPRSRLGVSTCGMLVRTAVWRDLDGLDPALPVFRDGVEFGWRAHLNGYRVVTTPDALVIHRQVGRAGLRPRGLTGRRPGKVDRLLGMIVVAGHAPGKMLPLVWLRLAFSCLTHAVAYLIGKVPGRALDEILALGSFVAHPGRIQDLRTRTAEIDPVPGTDEVVRSLRPPWWNSLRVAAEALSGAASERYRSVAGDVDAASLDEMTGDDFSSVADERPRHAWLSPIVITTAVAIVASLIAARGLFGLGSLAAPALLPAHEKLSDLWHAVVAPIPGAPGQVTPAVAGAGRARLDGAGRATGVVQHRAAVRRGAARAADGVPGRPPTDQRPAAAALGRGHATRCFRCCWAGPIRAGSPSACSRSRCRCWSPPSGPWCCAGCGRRRPGAAAGEPVSCSSPSRRSNRRSWCWPFWSACSARSS